MSESEVLKPLTLPPISAEQVKRYAEASKDFNPIHLSATAAAAAGLDAPIVHGMFIMGQFEILLRRWPLSTIVALSAQFLRPLPVGASLIVAGRIAAVSDSSCKVRLTARNSEDQLVAIGEATMLLNNHQ
jgi:acyl dehydratase